MGKRLKTRELGHMPSTKFQLSKKQRSVSPIIQGVSGYGLTEWE